MPHILLSLPHIFNSYKSWVSKNPDSLGDWENSVKWISYFLAGRINNSHVVSELIYCLSNLVVLFNDVIIKGAHNISSNKSVEKLKLWLAVIEYSEVFCELSAAKLWNKTGKWIVVVCIQVFKCIARLLLIFHYKEPIIQSPLVPVLNRKNLDKADNFTTVRDIAQSDIERVSFTLKRSGKVVRKIDSAPPLVLRDWKPLSKPSLFNADQIQSLKAFLATRQLIAESIYIAKPLVHLASMACFGTKMWKPWMLSFALDIASLGLYRSCTNKNRRALTSQQQLQVSRRTFSLLLYLLRSPVYDKFSKNKINSFLMALSKIPLAGLVSTPLAQYLPFWQRTYFYMWST